MYRLVASRALPLLLLLGAAAASEPTTPDCGDKDSIGCLQRQLYAGARDLFSRPKVELWGGLSLERTSVEPSRAARQLEEMVDTAKSPAEKEKAIEDYVIDRTTTFLKERSLRLNLAEAAETMKQAVASEDTEEGRGKKKKLLRALLPVLIGIKMKLVGFIVLSYFVIALIAKKALLASLVSLAISGFIAIKKLMSQQHTPHHEVHEVAHGWAGGYSGGGGGGWDGGYDSHGAYSNSVAHSIAYPGQKPSARYSEKSSM